jgi:hypothetical protein
MNPKHVEAAEKWVSKEICFGGLEYALSGKTAEECTRAFLAGIAHVEKEYAGLVEVAKAAVEGDLHSRGEYVRQVDGSVKWEVVETIESVLLRRLAEVLAALKGKA